MIDRNYQSFFDTIDKLKETEWYVLLQQKDFEHTSNDTLSSVPLACRAFLASISKKQKWIISKILRQAPMPHIALMGPDVILVVMILADYCYFYWR